VCDLNYNYVIVRLCTFCSCHST